MDTKVSPDTVPAAAAYTLAGAGVGMVIVDVDKDGQIEDGDTVLLVQSDQASVTDIAFGSNQQIHHASGSSPSIGRADNQSGYTGQMQEHLRQLAQSAYDQLNAGQNPDAQVNAFVAAANAITGDSSITDHKFNFSSDVAFKNANGVVSVFDVKSAGGAAAIENVDIQLSQPNGQVSQVVEFDNLWGDDVGDQLNGGVVRNAVDADQGTLQNLPFFSSVVYGNVNHYAFKDIGIAPVGAEHFYSDASIRYAAELNAKSHLENAMQTLMGPVDQ